MAGLTIPSINKVALRHPRQSLVLSDLGDLIGYEHDQGGVVFFPASGGFDNNITAFAGGGQVNATALNYRQSRITVCATLNDSVGLPKGKVGMRICVGNNGAATARVYPAVGEFYQEIVDNPASLAAGGAVTEFICTIDGHWI